MVFVSFYHLCYPYHPFTILSKLPTRFFAPFKDPSVYCPGGNWEPTPVFRGYYSVGGTGVSTRTDQVCWFFFWNAPMVGYRHKPYE